MAYPVDVDRVEAKRIVHSAADFQANKAVKQFVGKGGFGEKFRWSYWHIYPSMCMMNEIIFTSVSMSTSNTLFQHSELLTYDPI